jgi:hypothetical protein
MIVSQLVNTFFSVYVTRRVREAGHSPPGSAEVKKMWIYTSTSLYIHGVVLKHRDNFTFTLPVQRVNARQSVPKVTRNCVISELSSFRCIAFLMCTER